MMKLLIFTFLSFLSGALLSQEKNSIVAVYTVNDQNETLLPNVQLTIEQGIQTQIIYTDTSGKATCQLERFGELKTTFLHPLYNKHTTIEEIQSNTGIDTLYFSVTLTSLRSLNLQEVKVTAPGTPELVFSSKLKSVQDFKIIDRQNIILLAYSKRLKVGSQLLLYDPVGVIKDSLDISEEAIELIMDYEGHIYLLHRKGCKRIIINNNKLDVLDISLYYLKRYILPIVGTNNNNMYFSTYDQLYPAFDYYIYSVLDSTYTKFASIIDKEMMEMYRSEYTFVDMDDAIEVRQKLEAKNYELATGIDAAIYYGRKYFTRTVYYEPPFAPMFQVMDNLCLFDYHTDTLKIFNSKGELSNQQPITHDKDERKNGWQRNLIQDPISKTIYTIYERAGYLYLHSVNLNNGELSSPIKLNHRYAESIEVYNGFIYYIYRPFESYQKKYFWREKTPL